MARRDGHFDRAKGALGEEERHVRQRAAEGRVVRGVGVREERQSVRARRAQQGAVETPHSPTTTTTTTTTRAALAVALAVAIAVAAPLAQVVRAALAVEAAKRRRDGGRRGAACTRGGQVGVPPSRRGERGGAAPGWSDAVEKAPLGGGHVAEEPSLQVWSQKAPFGGVWLKIRRCKRWSVAPSGPRF